MPITINGVTHPLDSDPKDPTGTTAGSGDLGALAATAGAAALTAAGVAETNAKAYADSGDTATLAAAKAYTDSSGGGGGGVTDHGALTGLGDDDHTQYALADGSRGAFATTAQGGLADTATQPGDDAATLGSGAATDGQVLTADGAGGTAWETPSGGGAFPYPPITGTHSNWWAAPYKTGNGGHKGLGYASLYPLPIGQPVRITAFQVDVTGAGDGAVHAAIYGTVDGTEPAGADKVADLLVAADATTTGAKTATSLTIDLTPGLYWVAVLTTGTVQPTFAGTSDPLSLFVPKRSMTRNGGLEGASSLASLPATYPTFGNDFNISGSMLWYGLQTAVIP